jgi:zinc protease
VPGKITQKVYRGLEDKATVSMNFHGLYAYGEEQNMMLDGLKAILLNKLTERLREKESGVYSPSVSVREEKSPLPQYRINVGFNCSTANTDKLIAAVYEEIAKLKTSGVSQEDLDKFKAEEKRQLELKLRENNFWLGFIKSVYKDELREHRLQLYPVMLEGLTTEKIQAAAKTYFDENSVATVVLLPENAKAK